MDEMLRCARDDTREGLVLFDLDLTLLPIDSDHAWNDFMARLGWVDADAFKRGNDAFYADYQAGRLDIAAYIAFACEPLRQRSAAERAAAHERFMREVVLPQVRTEARVLVDAHRRRGDRMAIVTSTSDFITRPIAAAFGVDALIATRLELDASATPTGRIDGVPAFREGKVARVGQWLAESGADWTDFATVTVYSDSPNDLPLLEKASDPVATNPSAELETIARGRGWRILNLFA